MEKATCEQSQIVAGKSVENFEIVKLAIDNLTPHTSAETAENIPAVAQALADYAISRMPQRQTEAARSGLGLDLVLSGIDHSALVCDWKKACHGLAWDLVEVQKQAPTQSRIESMSYADYQTMMYDSDNSISQGEMKQAYRAHMRAYYTQDGREVPSKWL